MSTLSTNFGWGAPFGVSQRGLVPGDAPGVIP
jgi:hypothetical protein